MIDNETSSSPNAWYFELMAERQRKYIENETIACVIPWGVFCQDRHLSSHGVLLYGYLYQHCMQNLCCTLSDQDLSSVVPFGDVNDIAEAIETLVQGYGDFTIVHKNGMRQIYLAEVYDALNPPPPLVSDTKPGFIYLMGAPNELVKIGKSKNPVRRMTELTVGPVPISLLASARVFNMSICEKWLHERFKSKRVRGEWFSLSELDIKEMYDVLPFSLTEN